MHQRKIFCLCNLPSSELFLYHLVYTPTSPTNVYNHFAHIKLFEDKILSDPHHIFENSSCAGDPSFPPQRELEFWVPELE
eukprot:10324624-Ditylum_brightwellii.AAC.1